MKRFTFLVLITFFSIPALSGEIAFIKNDWQKAREMAAVQDKMLLVDFYTDWCKWCRVMDTTTFRDPAVVAYVNEHFIPLSIDAERDFGITVAMKYRVNAYPTYGYFTPDGRLVLKSLGYQPADEYIDVLRNAVTRSDSGLVYEGVTPETDLEYPEFFRLASGTRKARKNPEQGIVDAWLAGQEDLFAEVPFSVICRFSTPETISDFVIGNSEKYEKLYGTDDVEMKISSIISDRLRSAIRENDAKMFEGVLNLSDTYEKGDRDARHQRYRMRFYSGTGDWKKYAEMVSGAIDAGTMSDGAINSAAWTIYENCEDAAIVKQAVVWMAKIITDASPYAYLDTYAAVLFKGGEREKAETYALKAIEKGRSEEEDVASTEELLTKIRGQIQ